MEEKRKKILIIRLSSLGDLVLSTAALAPFRGQEISFVTKKNFSSLLENIPGVKIYSYDSRADGEGAARRKFFEWFESQQFDLVLDLQDSWRTWSWRSRMKKTSSVHVARKERLREWLILLARLGRWIGFGRGGRAKKFWRAAVRAAEVQSGDSGAAAMQTKLSVSESERARVKPFLPEGPFAVLLPVSAWKGKEWPYFSQLAAAFAKNVPVVVLGGPEDLVCDEVARRAQAVRPESVSLRGKTSVRESMAVIEAASWVVGNDTGMVHVAEALGKDVAMIEGPTHEKMGFSPYRPGSLLIGLDLVCRPCSKTGRICWRFGTRKCLNDLSVEEVKARLRERGYPC